MNDAPLTNSRVLIVDDDVDAGDGLGLLFDMAGFEVTVVRGPRAAFTAAQALAPAAIVTDIRMPSLDGHSLVRALRSFHADGTHPLYVAFSGLDLDGDEVAEYRSAFDLWFSKPEGLASIVDAVRAQLTMRQVVLS